MVVLEDVRKTYRTREGDVHALRKVNLRVERGRFVVLCGPSGSGKTTLLMAVAAMLRPSSGRVLVDERDVYAMSIRERAAFRASRIGFVFQMFHLIPYLNIVENVLVADGLCGRAAGTARAMQLLDQLGLSERATHRPGELSAGEKQRVAIARALFNEPALILADEPTGNLDPENARSVLGYLSQFHRAGGTVIVATHGRDAERFADEVVYMRAGRIEKRQ